MVHREAIIAPDGGTIATDAADPILEIGSGIHAHSYLLRRDGYWIQSPLTWYSDPGSWDLSPGYDPASGATFDRVINTDCVFCHVGQIRIHGNDPQQFEIVEHTIGCERCHGPGDRHVAAQREQARSRDGGAVGIDAAADSRDQIVNPASLSRERSEAICSQCHLQGIVASGPPDSNRWSFRPGEDLGQTVTEFQLRGVDSQFRIVGHTEQLHQSACYQGSKTLTCITCHDPHAPRPTAAAFRQMCLDCHQSSDCGVPGGDRMEINNDDCNQCHMPIRPTNVTHAALHDHRIAVHERSYQLAELPLPEPLAAPGQAVRPDLVPISEQSGLKPPQQQRRRALAVHALLFQGNLPVELSPRVGQAQATLLQLYKDGVRDPNVAVTLAHVYLNSNMLPAARQLARQSVGEQIPGSRAYAGAAEVLAKIALREQDNREALKWFQELTRVRRVSGDHFMLGVCQLNAGNVDEAVSALEQALRIDPALLPAHEDLQRIFAEMGAGPRSRAHGRAVKALRALSSAMENDALQ